MRKFRLIDLACGAALLVSTPLYPSATLAQPASPDRAMTAVTPPAKRPVMAISFIAGATENGMRALNRSLKALKPKKQTFMMAFVNEQPMDNPAAWTIPKTIFWVTPFYQQLVTELGEGAVVLNPLIVDADENGEAVLTASTDLSGAPVEVYFQAYQYPGYNGTTNTIGPRSEGDQITPMTLVLDARERRTNSVMFASIVERIPQKAMSSYAQEWLSGEEFTELLGSGPEKLPEQAKTMRKVVKKVRAEAAPIIAMDSDANHQQRYADTAGLPKNPLISDLLNAETRFRAIQSRRFVHYVWNSPLGDSLQSLLAAERKGQKALDAAWLSAGISGLKAGGGMALFSSLANAQPAMSAMGRDMTAATFPVLAQQVKITSDIAQSSAVIEASSLQELRAKFKVLAARADKRP